MDDEDFLSLIALVEEQFREIGAPELANEAGYLVDDPETETSRLLLRGAGSLRCWPRSSVLWRSGIGRPTLTRWSG